MRLEIEFPEERLGVIIGREGEVKRKIEEICKCKITISKSSISIECEDSLAFMKAKNVLLAIARGFSAEIALKMLENEDLIFESIDLSQLVSEKAMQRIMGRIIGKDGQIKKQIEELLNVKVSIYEKYVSLIGEYENITIAREALNMILEGAQHSRVIKFIERKRREMKIRSLDWI